MGGNFKGGLKAIWDSVTLCNLVGSSDISLAGIPDIMGVAGANIQQGRFVCRSCCQRERTLHLNESYKALGDFQVLVSKLLEVVLHCWKRSQPHLG